MARDFEREYDEYLDEAHEVEDEDSALMAYESQREAEAWHHEMAEPREPHDDGDDDIPPPDEPYPCACHLVRPDDLHDQVCPNYVEPPPEWMHEGWLREVDRWKSDLLAEVLRRRGWTLTPPDPNAGPLVTRNAPETSRQAARVAAVTGGTVEAHLLSLLREGGWTCDEIEAVTGRRHGSLSGAMNRLKRKGLVRESGETRDTRGGVPAAVYVLTDIDPIWRGSDT